MIRAAIVLLFAASMACGPSGTTGDDAGAPTDEGGADASATPDANATGDAGDALDAGDDTDAGDTLDAGDDTDAGAGPDAGPGRTGSIRVEVREAMTSVAAPWLSTVTFDPAELRDPARAPSSAIARALEGFAPDVVVIDLFWVPLVFVPMPAPAWLLLRSVPKAWLLGPKEARFDANRYARVFAMEPAPGLEPFTPLPPPVVASRGELRSRDDLCARLGVSPDGPLRLLLRAGTPSDEALLRAEAARVGGTFIDLSLDRTDAPFPAASWLASMRDGDVCVSGAGFNTFWEARLLGYDRFMRFVPLPRTFDDQAFRISLLERSPPTANGADVLARALLD